MVPAARARYVLCRVALVLLAAAAGSAFAMAPAGRAAAQPQPTIVLSPSGGPCDGTIQITGSGFPMPSGPYPFVTVYLLQPGSTDINMGFVTRNYVRPDGTLTEWDGLLAGCHAAVLDSRAGQPTGHLVIAAAPSFTALDPGARIPDIIATAQYAYTTTGPPAQLTMVLSPASGPCDFPVEVMGRGFPVPSGPEKNQDVYLLRPGTTDVSMGFLTDGNVNQDGAFAQWFGLHEHGCEAATLDSQAEQPTGYLAIAAAPQRLAPGPGLQPGERIPNITAVAYYRYTATTPPPPPVMAVSPSSGPCDGVVEVTGTGFQPEQDVSLGWAYPSSEAPEGDLASVQADVEGAFAVQITLGATGCGAAGTYPARDPTPARLLIDAEAVGPPVQVGSALARAVYALTTTEIGATPPQSLPATGTGPSEPSLPLAWLALAGVLAGLGVALLVASLCRKRQHG